VAYVDVGEEWEDDDEDDDQMPQVGAHRRHGKARCSASATKSRLQAKPHGDSLDKEARWVTAVTVFERQCGRDWFCSDIAGQAATDGTCSEGPCCDVESPLSAHSP
jgi:hypothetical protein